MKYENMTAYDVFQLIPGLLGCAVLPLMIDLCVPILHKFHSVSNIHAFTPTIFNIRVSELDYFMVAFMFHCPCHVYVCFNNFRICSEIACTIEN